MQCLYIVAIEELLLNQHYGRPGMLCGNVLPNQKGQFTFNKSYKNCLLYNYLKLNTHSGVHCGHICIGYLIFNFFFFEKKTFHTLCSSRLHYILDIILRLHYPSALQCVV